MQSNSKLKSKNGLLDSFNRPSKGVSARRRQ